MRVQAYTAYTGILVVTVATHRAEVMASTKFTAASIHEDYAASVRKLMKEHRHVGSSSLAFPAAQRLQTYFPTHGGSPLFELSEIQPSGSPRDIDDQWQLEIMRIRYSFALNLLPAAFLADQSVAEAIERHVEFAVRQLFAANDVPDAFIPGDEVLRPGTGTEIDIACELGAASGRRAVEVPAP